MCWEATMVWSLRQHLLPVFGLLFIIECIISLKLLELRVPAYVPLGARAQLWCRWQLGAGDALYAVKWYKDGKEFFRHVPKGQEQQTKFPLPGVQVEEHDSSGGNLTLAPAVLETGGRYRCEVSGERPLFPTVSDHGDMMVVVLPDHGPILSGLQPRYRPGDHIQVNCTSGLSLPATCLSWYINGEPAANTLPPLFDKHEGLVRTTLLLDFVVKESDFVNNGLKVKCLATVAPLYWRSNEESALKERTIHDKLLQSSPLDDAGNRDLRTTRADRVLASRGTSSSGSKHIGVFAFMFCMFVINYN